MTMLLLMITITVMTMLLLMMMMIVIEGFPVPRRFELFQACLFPEILAGDAYPGVCMPLSSANHSRNKLLCSRAGIRCAGNPPRNNSKDNDGDDGDDKGINPTPEHMMTKLVKSARGKTTPNKPENDS